MFKTLGVTMCKYFYSMLVLVFISCSGTKPKMLLPEKVSPDVYEVLLENDISAKTEKETLQILCDAPRICFLRKT